MKIVLKPETEDDFRRLALSLASDERACPEYFGLDREECESECYECWATALKKGTEDE